jgi:prepilin-type N-terminal cleavage/methylation domain-containing protein
MELLEEKNTGFTLIELMVVIAILGVLAATSVPLYSTYRQMGYRTEATMMLKSLLDGEISYFLENNKFFPGDGVPIIALYDEYQSENEIDLIKNNLNVSIPSGHKFDYYIATYPNTADESCFIIISAPFPLFRDGTSQIVGSVNKDGVVTRYMETVNQEEVEQEKEKEKKEKKEKREKK